MTVRPAGAGDVAAVHTITVANATAPQWTVSQFAEIFRPDPGSAVQRGLLVAEDEDGVAGFAVVSALGTVYPVQAETESIAVLPEHQGKGVGRALLEAVFAWCREKQVAELHLEVRVSNTNAITLYERAGFTPQGIRPGYYERPAEDAMCMMYNSFPMETLPQPQ